ncbi:MAG: hypothetical protein J0I43_02245 [Microbacterium sp.]|uniref:hypothetical protein n=1 Tax=Microbacterium sp. TaxID=51671 RepID=UPI001AC3D01E|nr:hypothetical protein [Microbacterium sp.]MBN9176179.1 hypothetical protein [Microbacterium sp.]
MTTTRPLSLTLLALGALLCAGCAGGGTAPADTAASDPSTAVVTPSSGDDGAAAGGAFGCTDAMISFMDANGYSDPTPHDPSDFTLPEASTPSVRPDCYVDDEFGSAHRKGAMFTGDTAAALAAVGDALTAAGYQQTSGYGTSIWWLDGEDPSSARYAVGAGEQTVDGQTVVWMTWAE